MPAISVIVPTRLRHSLLARTIRSLKHQTFRDFEIIVVDDNPPQKRLANFPELADLLSESNIRVVIDENPKNAARARNLGLKVANGEWIAYLDDDDAYREKKLELQFKLAKESNLPIGFSGLAYQLGTRVRYRHLDKTEYKGDELLLEIQAFATLFHRNCELLFNEDLNAGEDAYMFYSLVKYFGVERVFNVPEPLMDIYPQPGSRVNTNPEGVYKAMVSILNDFGSLFSPSACQIYGLRAKLAYYKLSKGNWLEMFRTANRLLKLRGKSETRLIINSFCYKFPWARRFFVG
ncbi:MAG: glycosyltransferase family 2 protein [Verrucomicrobiia bacterium]